MPLVHAYLGNDPIALLIFIQERAPLIDKKYNMVYFVALDNTSLPVYPWTRALATTPSATAALVSLLTTNTALTTLDLCGSTIDDKEASRLAIALATNTALTVLTLDDTNVGAEGATAMATALAANTALTKLALGGNSIGDAGAAALATALATTRR
jgi:hypothetical protein